MRLKVIGAGSAGTHIAHAARQLNWDVEIFDINPDALERMRHELYPKRYGAWDEDISFLTGGEHSKVLPDIVAISTPPESHLFYGNNTTAKKAVLIEKPLRTPSQRGAVGQQKVPVFVGYNHLVSPAVERMVELLPEIGTPLTLDVEWRESWKGILAAHPWLKGPEDSYLGYWKRGGGALSEHSHGLALWLHIARACGFPEVTAASVVMAYEGTYDKAVRLGLAANDLVGHVAQDVVTDASIKKAHVQGSRGSLVVHFLSQADLLVHDGKAFEFPKTRSDEFVRELKHINAVLRKPQTSPLYIDYAAQVSDLIGKAHGAMQARV